jgi:hypothetical protein
MIGRFPARRCAGQHALHNGRALEVQNVICAQVTGTTFWIDALFAENGDQIRNQGIISVWNVFCGHHFNMR